ncbi:hypothetical protein OH492_08000 [Vibrio chagasii]|nr:hypothetical protein [Vibrio chagasii]
MFYGNKSRADHWKVGRDTSDLEMVLPLLCAVPCTEFRVDQAIAGTRKCSTTRYNRLHAAKLTRLRLDSELQGYEIRYQQSPKSVSKELLSLEAQYQKSDSTTISYC